MSTFSISSPVLRRITASTLFISFTALSACAGNSRQESTGGYVDDTVITTKVKAAVFSDPELKSAEINVETFKGRVQLSGFVHSQADINHAIDIARSIDGVKAVTNDMHLK
jgi:osmotically-inducible protein OsmY